MKQVKPSRLQRSVLLGMVATLGLALAAHAGISGSSHDFFGQGWNHRGEICVVCHAPHNALTSGPNAPLWNHEITSATYAVYSSVTLDAVVGQPDGISKLCLSCHDGTVALDNFSGVTAGTHFISGAALVGTDLANDHPISIAYTSALATADGELHDPGTTNSGLGGTIDDDLLFGARLECASCHDVHNSGGFPKLLRKSNAASALCLTCHSK